MSSSELTPTTDDVRDWYSLRYMHEEYESEYRAEFDRWLKSYSRGLLERVYEDATDVTISLVDHGDYEYVPVENLREAIEFVLGEDA